MQGRRSEGATGLEGAEVLPDTVDWGGTESATATGTACDGVDLGCPAGGKDDAAGSWPNRVPRSISAVMVPEASFWWRSDQ